jgi:hypothetical protein
MTAQKLTWREDRKVAWPMKKLGHALLGATEGAMLYYIARDWCSGKRQIVDAGSFLGASASLLGKGLRDNSKRQADVHVHCYDLWEAKFGGLIDFIREKIDPDFPEGADFTHLFLNQVEEVADLIKTYRCDFEETSWDGGEIDLLFIDIAKTPSLNRVALERLLPSVVVDGFMVQQDFHNPDNPWIQTSLGYLLDYLEVVESRADDSAFFRIRREIPREVLMEAGRYEDLGFGERLDRLEMLIAGFRSENFNERYLELIKARLVIESGDHEGGLAILKAADDRVGPNPGIEDFFWERRCDKVRNSEYVVN